MEPGIYEQDVLPDEAYHALPYASKSMLWKLHSAPANLTLEQLRKYITHQPAEAYQLDYGRAFDDALSNLKNFKDRYIIGPTKTAYTKAWVEQKAQNAGKVLITETDYLAIPNMIESIRNHPVAGPLIFGQGRWQVSIIWDDERTGVRCKGRIDRVTKWINPQLKIERVAHVDVKTARTADPTLFNYDARKYGYHVQAAHYSDGTQRLRPGHHRDFVFVVVEKEPLDFDPLLHRVEVFTVDEYDLETALRVRDALLEQWSAVQSGAWKPQPSNPHRLWLPKPLEEEYGDKHV